MGGDRMTNIYVASSWRNRYQPRIVARLRAEGHTVYDFRNPAEGNDGFHWSEISPLWQHWSPRQFATALRNPIARDGFTMDMAALIAAEVVVLLLPSGRSSHIEAAYHLGRGRPVIVHMPEQCEPELMYKMFQAITTDEQELVEALWVNYHQLMHLIL